MEMIGGGFFWQEMTLGRKLRTRGRTITETDLVNYVGLSWFNEQIFTNEEYIRNEAHIKGRLNSTLLISGLQMISLLALTGNLSAGNRETTPVSRQLLRNGGNKRFYSSCDTTALPTVAHAISGTTPDCKPTLSQIK